jgi:hypothetical protein
MLVSASVSTVGLHLISPVTLGIGDIPPVASASQSGSTGLRGVDSCFRNFVK